jgi:hypothetical protein
MGVVPFTPEYRDTAITALDGAALSVAVTTPLVVVVPSAFHTSTLVWFLPAHWAFTKVQVNPRPLTDFTETLPAFVAIAAR